MWPALGKFVANLIDFAKGTKKNAEEIAKTNKRVAEMSDILLTVLVKLESLEKMEAKERQILILQLKNILLEHDVKSSEVKDLNPPPSLEP